MLVTSGDISCFRQSGRGCRGSEAARVRVGEKMKRNGEHERSDKLKVKCQKQTKSEWRQDVGTLCATG